MAATPHLLGLPVELRLRIFRDLQHHCLHEAKPVDICLYRGPDNTFRRVCRRLYTEPKELSEDASLYWSQQRRAVCQAIMAHATFTFSIAANWDAEADRVKDLYDGLQRGQQLPTCRHKCLITFHHWFQCNNWKHIDCLTCGRWASLAVHCFMHLEDTPDLIVRGGGVYGTPRTFVGRLVERLSERYVKARNFNIPEMWWRLQLEKQRKIDQRVAIRREAISRCSSRVTSEVDSLSSDDEPIGMTTGAIDAMVRSFERRFYEQELEAIRTFEDEYCDDDLDWRAEWRRQRELRKAARALRTMDEWQ